MMDGAVVLAAALLPDQADCGPAPLDGIFLLAKTLHENKVGGGVGEGQEVSEKLGVKGHSNADTSRPRRIFLSFFLGEDKAPPEQVKIMASSSGSWPLWLLFTCISFISGNTTL